VAISNSSQLKNFLVGKPVEWGRIVAVRAAMRVIPWWLYFADNQRTILLLFRTLFTAMTVARWGEPEGPFFQMRQGVSSAADEAQKSDEAAYFACFSTFFANTAVDRIFKKEFYESVSSAVNNAAICASTINGVAGIGIEESDEFWRQVKVDFRLIENGGANIYEDGGIFTSPLWESQKPLASFTQNWSKMKAALLARGDLWSVWVQWYERILVGENVCFSGISKDSAKDFCVQLAGEIDKWWERDAYTVNGEIIGRINALITANVPSQAQGPLVTFEREGRVARQLAQAPADPRGRLHSAREALIESIDDFDAAFPSHNHSGLRQALVRLRGALGADYQQFDVIRAGAAAERIQGFALKADEIFVPEMAVEVVALNINVGRTLGNSEGWGEFCHGLDREPEPDGEDINAVAEVGQKLAESDAVEDEVKEELKDELLPFILPLEGDWGRPRERKILMRGVTNVLATMSKIALDYAKFVQGAAGDGHKDGIKKVTEAATVSFFMGLAALLLPLAGHSPMFAFLIPVLTYLSKFAQK